MTAVNSTSAGDFIKAAARNMAAWHDWQRRAQGLRCVYGRYFWACTERAPGPYLTAIKIRPAPSGETEAALGELSPIVDSHRDRFTGVCDFWQDIDLSSLGFAPKEPEPWSLRPPAGRARSVQPAELKIDRVVDVDSLVEFEEASVDGFEDDQSKKQGRWHVDATLGQPGREYFGGRVDGRIVSVSIAVVSDGVVGTYGVATIPAFRRRGYGAAMTLAALNVAPDLPAKLEPSEMGESMYRSLGFQHAGFAARWFRAP